MNPPTFSQFKQLILSRCPGREWVFVNTGLRASEMSLTPLTSANIAGYQATSGALKVTYYEAFLFPWQFEDQRCERFEDLNLPGVTPTAAE